MIEIDDIKHALERPITEAGDYIFDEYFVAIDLTTSPDVLRGDNPRRLASAIRRLNRNQDATCVYLERPGLVDTYNDVASQLNDINSSVDGVGELQPIVPGDSRNRNYSARFIHA